MPGKQLWKANEYGLKLLLWNNYLLWSRITEDQWKKKVLFSQILFWIAYFCSKIKTKFTTQNIYNKKSLEIFFLNNLDLGIIVFGTTTSKKKNQPKNKKPTHISEECPRRFNFFHWLIPNHKKYAGRCQSTALEKQVVLVQVVSPSQGSKS